MNISILGISEMRWPGLGKCMIDDNVVNYAGIDSNLHENGVALIATPEVAKATKKTLFRSVIMQVDTTSVTMNIIQMYAPTSDSDEDTIGQFYEQLEQALLQKK